MTGSNLSVEQIEDIRASNLSPEAFMAKYLEDANAAQSKEDVIKVEALMAESLAEVKLIKPMPKVTIDLDDMTLGDFENLEAGSVTALLKVLDIRLHVEGVADEDVPATLRTWKLADIDEIGDTIRGAVENITNPKRMGKN